ncbi:hypothetical protein [Vibrio alginolyticus]
MLNLNLRHCMQDCSGRLLLDDVLDAIQAQADFAYHRTVVVAGNYDKWLDEAALKSLLSEHSRYVAEQKAAQESQQRQRKAKQLDRLYACAGDKRCLIGELDHSETYEVTISEQDFMEYVAEQLLRSDISVTHRENLQYARYHLNGSELITIKNNEAQHVL